MYQFATGIGCILAALIGICPASADDITIMTATGEARVEANPGTLAALDFSAIDTLEALGVPPAAVPAELFADYLQDVEESSVNFGPWLEPDMEALSAIAPDLIVVGGPSVASTEMLSQIAPVIDMGIGIDAISDSKARLLAFGKLFGKEAKAHELADLLDHKLEKLKAIDTKGETGLIVLTNGAKMSAFGTGSRFGWIFDATGLKEAAAGLATEPHGNVITHEFIAEANPDWLFVIDRGYVMGMKGPTGRQTLTSELVAGTTAWQKDQVAYLDSGAIYAACGGYQSMTRIVDQLTTALSK